MLEATDGRNPGSFAADSHSWQPRDEDGALLLYRGLE